MTYLAGSQEDFLAVRQLTLRGSLDAVSFAIEPGAPWRTLWRSVLAPAARRVTR